MSIKENLNKTLALLKLNWATASSIILIIILLMSLLHKSDDTPTQLSASQEAQQNFQQSELLRQQSILDQEAALLEQQRLKVQQREELAREAIYKQEQAVEQEQKRKQDLKIAQQSIAWDTLASAYQIIISPLLNPDNKRYCGMVKLDKIENDAITGKLYAYPPDAQPYVTLISNDDTLVHGDLRFNAQIYFIGMYIANEKYLTVMGEQRFSPVFMVEQITTEKMPCGQNAAIH